MLSRCSKDLGRRGCVECSFITSKPSQIIKEVSVQNTGQKIKVEGKINCKSRGFLYLLWSRKVPTMQYIGSSEQEVRRRLGQHKGDILNMRLNKAVAKHFYDTRSTVADLMFVPFKLVKSTDRMVLRHFENQYINQFNLIEAGVNRILT